MSGGSAQCGLVISCASNTHSAPSRFSSFVSCERSNPLIRTLPGDHAVVQLAMQKSTSSSGTYLDFRERLAVNVPCCGAKRLRFVVCCPESFHQHERCRGWSKAKGCRQTKRTSAPQAIPPQARERSESGAGAGGAASPLLSDRTSELDLESKESNGESVNAGTGAARRELSALESYFNRLRGSVQEKPAASLSTWDEEKLTILSNVKQKLSAEEENGAFSAGKDSASTSKAADKDMNFNATSTSLDNDKQPISFKAKQTRRSTELRSLDAYLGKVGEGPARKKEKENTDHEEDLDFGLEEIISEIESIHGAQNFSSPIYRSKIGDVELDPLFSDEVDTVASESSVVYVLAAINIAVYLFGLASPVETPGMGISTLPLLFGAKVNELILDGQWWRLITPMFLHSGFFHIALSSWGLLTFGPQVESAYGSIAFCMIYFLGGLCGNIFSFFHTSDATVGGTGPFFAIFISWIVYLLQNRNMIGEQLSDNSIRMAVLRSAPIITFGLLLPIDEWIHLGAVCAGFLFGTFACPIVQEKLEGTDLPPDDEENLDGCYVFSEQPSLWKLVIVFGAVVAVCLATFSFSAPIAAEYQLLHVPDLF